MIFGDVVMRSPQKKDAKALLSYRNSPFVNRYNLYSAVTLKRFKRELKNPNLFVLVEKKTSIPMGCFYTTDDPSRLNTGSTEIVAWIGEDFANKGYISNLLPYILDFLFQQEGVRRISTRVFEKNIAANKIMAHVGFRLEGTLPEAILDHGGDMAGINLYSMSKQEFFERYKS